MSNYRSKNKSKDKLAYWIIAIVLLLMAALSLFPLVNIIAVSFSDKSAAEAGMISIFPVGFNFSSYKKILGDMQFFRSFAISVERVALGGTIQFLVTTMMAFPLSRQTKEFKARNVFMWFVVANMIFSGGMIPLYITINKMGLMNSIWALVLPVAVQPFNVILLMNAFRSVPKEMEEAARVDGAGIWFIFIKIFLPLSKSTIATVTLFSLVGHWNSFFDGIIYMNKTSLYPLATYVQSLIVQQYSPSLSIEEIIETAKISNKTLNAAKIVVCLIPILIIYPYLQKHFVSGIMIGSVKE